MKRALVLALSPVLIAAFAVFGLSALMQGMEYLQAGEMTYRRSGGTTVTVSATDGAFSFYYQVSFWVTGGCFCLFLACSFAGYLVAKLLRLSGRFESLAARLYSGATLIGWTSFALFLVWLLLRMLRSSLIR